MVDRKQLESLMNSNNLRAEIPQYKPEEIKAIVVQEATKQGVPVELALAVAQQESGFNNKAVSKKNNDGSRDHGVMQLNDKFHKLKNVYDPYENISYGVGMLREGLKRNNGDVIKTLSDYNAGANATGKERDAGNTYAQKVLSIAQNITPRNGIVTGAATPIVQGQDIGDAVAELSQGELTKGEKIIDKYIKNAGYDTEAYRGIRDAKQAEVKDALKQIKELPTSASPEELQSIANQYAEAKQGLNDAYKTAIAGIQSGIGPDTVDAYYNKLAKADEARIKRMQESNPYTRMAQQAPLDLQDYANAVNRQQQVNAMIRANNIAMGGQAQPVNFADERMQLAQARQAEEMARKTGLTPEQFVEGGLLDYKNMGTALNNQQQAMIQLLAAAQQGDRQAQQVLANMQVNQAINNNALTQNTIAAQQAANAAALDRAKFGAENTRWGVQQGQNLDMYPLSADASIQAEKLQQIGNIMNKSADRGTNAAGNMLNYQAMLQRADSNNQQSDPLKTYLDINKPVLSAAGMNQNIDALPNAIQAYQEGIARNFPQYAGYVYPNAPVNSFAPIQGLTGFDATGQNTFRPQQ